MKKICLGEVLIFMMGLCILSALILMPKAEVSAQTTFYCKVGKGLNVEYPYDQIKVGINATSTFKIDFILEDIDGNDLTLRLLPKTSDSQTDSASGSTITLYVKADDGTTLQNMQSVKEFSIGNLELLIPSNLNSYSYDNENARIKHVYIYGNAIQIDYLRFYELGDSTAHSDSEEFNSSYTAQNFSNSGWDNLQSDYSLFGQPLVTDGLMVLTYQAQSGLSGIYPGNYPGGYYAGSYQYGYTTPGISPSGFPGGYFNPGYSTSPWGGTGYNPYYQNSYGYNTSPSGYPGYSYGVQGGYPYGGGYAGGYQYGGYTGSSAGGYPGYSYGVQAGYPYGSSYPGGGYQYAGGYSYGSQAGYPYGASYPGGGYQYGGYPGYSYGGGYPGYPYGGYPY